MDLPLDEIDQKIIDILSNDHRKPYTQIASELGISRNTVQVKIKRLVEKEIIKNYTILLDPNWFFQKIIFIEIKTNPHEPWLANQLQSIGECELIDGTIGEYSLILKCRIREDFNAILKQIDSLMAKSASKKYQIIDIIHCYKENGYKFSKDAQKGRELDQRDLKLIEMLREQGKKPITTSQLSQHLKLSQPAVFKRIKRLEEENIIEKFTISLNYKRVGIETKFYVRIKVDPASYDTVAFEFLSEQPEITDLYRTGENYGLLAIVRTENINSYNHFIQNLYTDSRIIDTHTTLVLEERKK